MNNAMMGVGKVAVVPTLVAASASIVTPADSCAFVNWDIGVSYTVNNPDDALYQIDIDYCTTQGCTPATALVTGQTTVSSTYHDSEAVTASNAGTLNGVTDYRTFKVKLVRKSDSSVISSITTNEVSEFHCTDACI